MGVQPCELERPSEAHAVFALSFKLSFVLSFVLSFAYILYFDCIFFL